MTSLNFDDTLRTPTSAKKPSELTAIMDSIVLDEDDDGEAEFKFSQQSDQEKTTSPTIFQSLSEGEKSPPLITKKHSSDEEISPSSQRKKRLRKKSKKSTLARSENDSDVSTQEQHSGEDQEAYNAYLTPDENEKPKEQYALRRTPVRDYHERRKQKKRNSDPISITEIVSSDDDKAKEPEYHSDEIPDEDIEAMESKSKKRPETEEERKEREAQEEIRKKREKKQRKNVLEAMSSSARKKNKFKSIYQEDDEEMQDSEEEPHKRKGLFDEDELYSQQSSQEKEVFSSPRKRLKRKNGEPVKPSSPLQFDEEEANSDDLEMLREEIRENHLLLNKNKKKALKLSKRRSKSSSEEEESPVRRRKPPRKSRDDSENEDYSQSATMSQFIVSDEEEEEEQPSYNVYRMVDMMDMENDSQEMLSLLTGNARVSVDLKTSFTVYIHFITSCLLDEDFIKTLKLREKTEFSNAAKMVEGKIATMKESLIYSSVWSSRHADLLQYYPLIKAREISIKDTEREEDHNKICQACGRKNHMSEFVLIFKPPRATTKYEFSSGADIHWIDSPDEDEENSDTIQLSQRRATSSKSKSKPSFMTQKEKSFVGSTCYKRSLLYHNFQHYKFHLIQNIIAKIDKIAENYSGEEEITSDYILDKIMSKKSWIDGMYKKFLKLLDEAEACYANSKETGIIDVVDELFDVYDSEEVDQHHSEEEDQDKDFVVTNTRGGLRLKRTKPRESEEEEEEDAEFLEDDQKQPKPSNKTEQDDDGEPLQFDKEEVEEVEPPQKKSETSANLQILLDPSDDELLNYSP